MFACGEAAPDVAAGARAHRLNYQGGGSQFAGGFSPRAPYGGFGGGSCTAVRTPVIFLHGNGDVAQNWDFPPSTGGNSVYETFRNAGYSDCELFGLNYLSPAQQSNGAAVYHEPALANRVADFIEDVQSYTGSAQVDIVAHSLGVTVGLEALRLRGKFGVTRRFIGIAGALRGLASCYYAGWANPAVPTCGSANIFNGNIFGFYPHSWWARNPRMGNGGFRDDPGRSSGTRFYTIRAGNNDQVHCTTTTYYSGCDQTARFDSRSNVIAQLDVGDGSTANQLDFDFSDWSPYVLGAGDVDGVGHFRSKNNTGLVQVEMLTSACQGTGCCGSYSGVCN